MDYENWREWAYNFTLIACVSYIVLTVLGMLVYTGGTYANVTASGYNFFENYFSDIGRTVSHSGNPNGLGSFLFILAMVIGGLAIVGYYIAVIENYKDPSRLKVISIIGSVVGVLAGLAFIGVALFPADTAPDTHRLLMYMSFGSILVTSLVYTIAMYLRDECRNNYQLANALFTGAAAAYMLLMFFGPDRYTAEGLLIQAAGQKIIIYLMIVNFYIQAYSAKNFGKK